MSKIKCCGKYAHLRLLTKQLGRQKARKYLATVYAILPVNETSTASLSAGNRRRPLVVKTKRKQGRLEVTAVYWQRKYHVPPRATWWLKNSPFIARFAFYEAMRSALRFLLE